MFVVGVILEIDKMIFVAAATSEIDHVSVAGILREQNDFFTQTIVIEILVKFAVGQVVGVQ
jgi:hypothetical protein